LEQLENPTLEFLIYLIKCCLAQCEVDPDKTTITEFIRKIEDKAEPFAF